MGQSQQEIAGNSILTILGGSTIHIEVFVDFCGASLQGEHSYNKNRSCDVHVFQYLTVQGKEHSA